MDKLRELYQSHKLLVVGVALIGVFLAIKFASQRGAAALPQVAGADVPGTGPDVPASPLDPSPGPSPAQVDPGLFTPDPYTGPITATGPAAPYVPSPSAPPAITAPVYQQFRAEEHQAITPSAPTSSPHDTAPTSSAHDTAPTSSAHDTAPTRGASYDPLPMTIFPDAGPVTVRGKYRYS